MYRFFLVSILDSSEEEEEETHFPLAKDSDSSSSDDEDIKVFQRPQRQIRSTPNITRKESSGTPAKTSKKTVTFCFNDSQPFLLT